jgi:hypothetical protein
LDRKKLFEKVQFNFFLFGLKEKSALAVLRRNKNWLEEGKREIFFNEIFKGNKMGLSRTG